MHFLRLDFLGVTVNIVTVDFIIMDWTGSAASHTKSNYCSKQRGYG
jgi:hypothetical protein